MSVVGVRVGRCSLCGFTCNGTRCAAHSDLAGDNVWIDLHIASLLSPLARGADRNYGSPMDAAEQREAVRDYTFPPGTSVVTALAALPPLPAGTLIEVWQSDDAVGVQVRQPTRERVA